MIFVAHDEGTHHEGRTGSSRGSEGRHPTSVAGSSGLPNPWTATNDPEPLSPPAPRERHVHLERVTKSFGSVRAVNDVTLDVLRGEFLAVLGPSGSGKTTLMRIIGGFVHPDSGRVEIRGRDVTDHPPNRRDVNTVFQSYALFPHMSVERNVGYGLRVTRVPRAERQRRVREALDLVRLEHVARMRPSELSGGMQQRVALARAVVNRPTVLLLDEPLGALDRKLREDMQVELRLLQTELGITFIYVTHDQDEALGMSDRLVVMKDGRIEQIGEPEAVYDRPANLWVATFVGSSNQIVATVRSLGRLLELESDAMRLFSADAIRTAGVGSRVTAVVRPERVQMSRESGSSDRNRVRVRVREVLTLGGQVKVVASTPGGLELLARRERQGVDDLELRPGDEVWFSWPPEAVRIYELS
jgi:spermidine/putrescine ABC transporter ATP-binding subunit